RRPCAPCASGRRAQTSQRTRIRGAMRTSVSKGRVGKRCVTILALLVAGCVASPMDQRRDIVVPIAGRAADRVPAPEPEPEPEQQVAKEPLILRGDDQLFKPPRPLPEGVRSGDPVSLDFEQAAVTEVVH